MLAVNKSPAVYILSPALDELWRENRGPVNRLSNYDQLRSTTNYVLRRLQAGWGGTPLYKLYRYVPPHLVGFLRRFGQKTGIFAHFGLESDMVFEACENIRFSSLFALRRCGRFRAKRPQRRRARRNGCFRRLRIYRFSSKWVRKKEKCAKFEVDLKNFFVCTLISVMIT